MTPSSNSGDSEDNLMFDLLKDSQARKLYNKTLLFAQKQRKCESQAIFLKDCVAKNLIPQSFKIKNQPDPKASKSTANKFLEKSKEASSAWIKESIKDIEKEEVKNHTKYVESFNDLCTNIPNELHDFVWERVESRSKKFENIENRKKSDKLKWLLKKEIPPQESVDPDIENIENEQHAENHSENKDKKKRKARRGFIPKNRWQRLQRSVQISV